MEQEIGTPPLVSTKGSLPSNRGKLWAWFQDKVANHIECYTVKQYGDFPDDLASDYTPEYCIIQIKKLANRYGQNARGTEEELRDLLKIAHFACICHVQRIFSKNALKRMLCNDKSLPDTDRISGYAVPEAPQE